MWGRSPLPKPAPLHSATACPESPGVSVIGRGGIFLASYCRACLLPPCGVMLSRHRNRCRRIRDVFATWLSFVANRCRRGTGRAFSDAAVEALQSCPGGEPSVRYFARCDISNGEKKCLFKRGATRGGQPLPLELAELTIKGACAEQPHWLRNSLTSSKNRPQAGSCSRNI